MSSLHYEVNCLLKTSHFPELSVLLGCIIVVMQFNVTWLENSHVAWYGLLQVTPVYI